MKSKRTSPKTAPSTEIQFGTAYYPDHWPETEWARDLDRIVDAGVDTVRFGEFSWSWFEPSPGEFDFSAYHRFVDLIEQRPLKLVLCTPTATPPPWMDRLFPDGRLQNAWGQPTFARRHFWCWDHEASRLRAEDMIRRLAGEFRERKSVIGWQIDNEMLYAESFTNFQPQNMYTFHPSMQAKWVEWLKAKYESLDELNAKWWTNFWSQRYSSWDELLIQRGANNPHLWLDYLRWREVNLADYSLWQYKLLKDTKTDWSVGTNIPEAGLFVSLCGGFDPWSLSRGLDWIGTDLYQATGNRAKDIEHHAYSTSLMKSAAGPADFFIAETQAGPQQRAFPQGFAPEAFGPDYLKDSAETYIEHGATQIWWFLWRPTHGGVEIGMNGVQDLDGSDTPRTEICRNLAKHSTQQKLLRRRSRYLERPRACIHYSRDSYRHITFHDPSGKSIHAIEEDLMGWHSLLEHNGYRADFIDDQGLAEISSKDTSLLVFPMTSLMEEGVAKGLADLDCRLVFGPHTAFYDEDGRLRAGGVPDELVAITDTELGSLHDVGELPSVRSWPDLTSYRELNIGADAKVITKLSNGKPLLVKCGETRTLAVDLGRIWWNANSSQHSRMQKVLRDILD